MEQYQRVAYWADSLVGTLYAAPVTPFTPGGLPEFDAAASYFASLVEDGADGLAVAVHSGRGRHLTVEARHRLTAAASRITAQVVCGLDLHRGIDEAISNARHAAEDGASALLLPAELDHVDNLRAFLDSVWNASSLPMLGFDLYLTPYGDRTFSNILHHPGVAGVKFARLFDAVACQDRIAQTRAAGRIAITGEDRMFGPSLTWGAQCALVGVAAAAPYVTRNVIDAFYRGDLETFKHATARLDRLAAAAFKNPTDGYVQRMCWLAVEEGRIPATFSTDPFAPRLRSEERQDLFSRLHELGLPASAPPL